MKKITKWYNRLSKRARDSYFASLSLLGLVSTIFSVIGISLGDIESLNILCKILIIVIVYFLVYCLIYWSIGRLYKDSIDLSIRNTSVTIKVGDIFKSNGLRVIGLDTHFDTRADDVVISKTSLHGQLVLTHSKKSDIQKCVNEKAEILRLISDSQGLYSFPLGTVIRYDSKLDNHSYLMVALTNNIEEDGQYKATTCMSEYEHTLIKMWKQIDGLYAGKDIVLPILGSGITRFIDGPKDSELLLRCILCTLNTSGVTFKSKVTILIYQKNKSISLYEYKNIYRMLPGLNN